VEIDQDQVNDIQEKILSFYDEHGRSLPWRTTHDAYKVWVSEVMLQQTQVSRVIPKYKAWMESYPAVDDLADASFKDVLNHWDGLGYNNRAKWLHQAAQQIIDEYDGELPRSRESLKDLPGIGPYTARAIQIFAYNEDVVTVDTNIRRVLISELGLDESLEETDLYDVAKHLLPEGRSRQWHNALMDYGAMVATSHETGVSPTSTQDAFEGSVRQARANILRSVKEDRTSVEAIRDDYPDRWEEALNGLSDDGLVTIDDGVIRLR
jgi:A/G-specific adenine glycosylase